MWLETYRLPLSCNRCDWRDSIKLSIYNAENTWTQLWMESRTGRKVLIASFSPTRPTHSNQRLWAVVVPKTATRELANSSTIDATYHQLINKPSTFISIANIYIYIKLAIEINYIYIYIYIYIIYTCTYIYIYIYICNFYSSL